MDSRCFNTKCKYEINIPCCPRCRRTGRVKERRFPAQTVPDGLGGAQSIRVERVRWMCPSCSKSWTSYEPGGYPYRACTLALAIAMVEALAANAQETFSSLARKFDCHRRTVARTVHWVGSISTPAALTEDSIQVDPAWPAPVAPPAPKPPGLGRRPSCLAQLALAGQLILLFEHLAGLLRGQGVPLEPGPGLAALLRFQRDRFGAVWYLTRASRPLRIPWPLGPPAD